MMIGRGLAMSPTYGIDLCGSVRRVRLDLDGDTPFPWDGVHDGVSNRERDAATVALRWASRDVWRDRRGARREEG